MDTVGIDLIQLPLLKFFKTYYCLLQKQIYLYRFILQNLPGIFEEGCRVMTFFTAHSLKSVKIFDFKFCKIKIKKLYTTLNQRII